VPEVFDENKRKINDEEMENKPHSNFKDLISSDDFAFESTPMENKKRRKMDI